MRLLVVSDSHGDRESLVDLHRRYDGAVDYMIHCGDSELQADDEVLQGFTIVAGNCDYDAQLKDRQLIEIGSDRAVVVHGHRHGVNYSLLKLGFLAEETGANVVFFGHTHLLGAEQVDGVLYLNPGSILLPRGGNPKSYAMIEKTDDKFLVEYYNEKHTCIKTLEF